MKIMPKLKLQKQIETNENKQHKTHISLCVYEIFSLQQMLSSYLKWSTYYFKKMITLSKTLLSDF